MTPDEIRNFVDEFYAMTANGDWEAVDRCITDDFFVSEAAGLPMEGIYPGRAGLCELYAKVIGSLDVAAIEREETMVGHDMGVVKLSLRFADPAVRPAEILELFLFRDGKLAEIKPYYFDPNPVVAAAASKAAQTA
ncbi:nuclear transport factor 2 family protein [Novosphingobium umbonatum]|uniref:Nuclear transport factor 2 family protein n=1 Tax=Novosphingobium umbonatum TaxID=1908524 RepID=A0A3S2USE5_9SPHN|nr:nuclear transport factor 2 family protein [Novosphingobium umbonatum]RVU05751.1 nuclear transport factor 2 family protein [Novosphingobium umbonatum]